MRTALFPLRLLTVALLGVSATARADVTTPQPTTAPATTLIQDALADPGFFKRLDQDPDSDKALHAKLADAAYRKFGNGRSVRVQLWRGTTVEAPAVVLEYQTQWKKVMGLQNRGTPQYDPVLIGTGRDNMLFRTFYGGTSDPAALEAFKALWDQRAKAPSNKRNAMDPKFVELAERVLPGGDLADVRANVQAEIEKLVAAHKAESARVLESSPYGNYGAKINGGLYLHIHDFAEDAPMRFDHDPMFWLIVSGGPKPMPRQFVPAFPGAEGFGAQATGGRGGKVIYVTTLNPDGPGSFKAALEAKGPRTVLFKVSGQIKLPDLTWIREPNLTVIGYTAPGEGVEIHGRLNIAADNVILRGMRYRLRPPYEQDGMNTEGNLRNIIFDHCSFAYDSDEALRFIGNGSTFLGFTIQYCIIGPGLAGLNAHPYGPEVGGYGSFHHNLFYNTLSRSPEVDCDLIDWSHNIMANLRSGHSLRPQSRFNFTHNAIINIPGNPNAYSFQANDAVWAQGNTVETEGKTSEFLPAREGVKPFLRQPYRVMPLTHDDAGTLEAKLLPIAGAFLPVRDATDAFFVAKLKARQSRLPYYEKPGTTWRPYGNENDNMNLYEKWDQEACRPPAAGAAAPADTDDDGMPDEWENTHKLNPNDPADAARDGDQDGYTNLEEFLYRTDPNAYVDYTQPQNNTHTLHATK